MRDADRLRQAVVERALRGPGRASADARCAAFDNAGADERARPLIDKVARNAWKVTDADVAAARTAGLPEDEIFELIVCAALGQATRQLQSARAALEEATTPPGGSATDQGGSGEPPVPGFAGPAA